MSLVQTCPKALGCATLCHAVQLNLLANSWLNFINMGASENSVPLNRMVLLIIIPNGYFIGNIPNIFRQTHISSWLVVCWWILSRALRMSHETQPSKIAPRPIEIGFIPWRGHRIAIFSHIFPALVRFPHHKSQKRYQIQRQNWQNCNVALQVRHVDPQTFFQTIWRNRFENRCIARAVRLEMAGRAAAKCWAQHHNYARWRLRDAADSQILTPCLSIPFRPFSTSVISNF